MRMGVRRARVPLLQLGTTLPSIGAGGARSPLTRNDERGNLLALALVVWG